MLKEIQEIAYSVKKSLSWEALQLQALHLKTTFTVWSPSIQCETWMGADFIIFMYDVSFIGFEERILN